MFWRLHLSRVWRYILPCFSSCRYIILLKPGFMPDSLHPVLSLLRIIRLLQRFLFVCLCSLWYGRFPNSPSILVYSCCTRWCKAYSIRRLSSLITHLTTYISGPPFSFGSNASGNPASFRLPSLGLWPVSAHHRRARVAADHISRVVGVRRPWVRNSFYRPFLSDRHPSKQSPSCLAIRRSNKLDLNVLPSHILNLE